MVLLYGRAGRLTAVPARAVAGAGLVALRGPRSIRGKLKRCLTEPDGLEARPPSVCRSGRSSLSMTHYTNSYSSLNPRC
jgi:hypothetical protein